MSLKYWHQWHGKCQGCRWHRKPEWQMTANTQITTMAQMIMTTPQITYMSYDVNCINDNNDTDDITWHQIIHNIKLQIRCWITRMTDNNIDWHWRHKMTQRVTHLPLTHPLRRFTDPQMRIPCPNPTVLMIRTVIVFPENSSCYLVLIVAWPHKIYFWITKKCQESPRNFPRTGWHNLTIGMSSLVKNKKAYTTLEYLKNTYWLAELSNSSCVHFSCEILQVKKSIQSFVKFSSKLKNT